MFEYLLYYPVTFILWVWHKVFGLVLGETNAISWVLGIVFLTFTVRAILFKPFVSQVRSMKKMQDFAPEIKKIQKRYANDKQRQAQAMQKLQREHGVNPLGGCLPILLQVPVFIGLNHTLRAFQFHYSETTWGNYFFDRTGVRQYIDADLFGSHLGEAIYNTGLTGGTGEGAFHVSAIPVAIPLMILASVLTHLTARHSVERQNPASATQQTAMMNKLTLYVFPIGLLVFGAFLPLGLLIYFLANNAWTLMQQKIVYTRIDREEAAKKVEQTEKRSGLAPKPGQKPTQQKKRSTTTSANGASGAADKATPSKDAASKDAASKGDGAKTASSKSTGASKSSSKSTASSKNTGTAKSTGAKKQGTSQGKAKGQSKSSGSSGNKTTQGKSSGNSSTESSSTAPQNGSGGSDSTSDTAKKKADRKRR